MYNKLRSMLCSANLPAPWFVLCSGLLSVNKRIVPIRPLSHCANDRESDLTESFFFLSIEPKMVSCKARGDFSALYIHEGCFQLIRNDTLAGGHRYLKAGGFIFLS